MPLQHGKGVKMRFGVQGFGALKSTDTDLSEFFRIIKSRGFQVFEPCISFFPIEGMERMIWQYEKYPEYAGLLSEAGLEVASCHVFSLDLVKDAKKMKALAKDFGITQFVFKSPQDLGYESLQKTAMDYMRLADELEEAGAMVLIHNEADDIRTRVQGKTAYEYLLDLCLGKVYAQVDAGWAMYGGEDPVALLWRNAYRIKSVHYKDFSGEKEVPIGTGSLPLADCLQFARAMGLVQIGDSDSYTDDFDNDIKELAGRLGMLGQSRDHSVSYLNTYDVETGEIKVLHRFDRVIEAPNWRKFAPELIYNSDGHIYRYNMETDTETMIDTDCCSDCNNDHVLSPDEKYIAISDSKVTKEEGFTSRIYIVPLEGGEARLITPNSASFLHGWSPDGKRLPIVPSGCRIQAWRLTFTASLPKEERSGE